MEEQGRLKAGSLPYRLFRRWNHWMVKRCRIILADTAAHAEYSSILNMLSIERYRTIPVNADETVFHLQSKDAAGSKKFTVLYYGHMLPLHGLQHVLDAAQLLNDRPNITFRLIGGKKYGDVARACTEAVRKGAHVTHEAWLPYEKLPEAIRRAGITLGGPFGGTLQSQFIITGKTFQPLACAAPVLIGRNQVQEGFADRENCLIVPQADPRALADAILWAKNHPEELKKIGLAGRRLYEQHFSQKIVNGLVQDIVKELENEQ
jgi:glycosyltransferase involved in cell wall biosynthesis